MRPHEREKVVTLLPPQLKDDGDFAGNTYLDTFGFDDKVRFEFHVGTLDIAIGSTDEATPPVIEQCDTAGGSYEEIDGAELAAVIGAGDEWHQASLPGRSADYTDFLTDVAAASLTVFVLHRWWK